jgi:hypothetical protein
VRTAWILRAYRVSRYVGGTSHVPAVRTACVPRAYRVRTARIPRYTARRGRWRTSSTSKTRRTRIGPIRRSRASASRVRTGTDSPQQI